MRCRRTVEVLVSKAFDMRTVEAGVSKAFDMRRCR